MNPSNNADGKQARLPLFTEEIVPVPTAKQQDLEDALAELLLGVAKDRVAGSQNRGECQ